MKEVELEGHVTRMGERTKTETNLVTISDTKRSFEGPMHKLQNNIEKDLKERRQDDVNYFLVTRDRAVVVFRSWS
jgi:hypothetical protein